MKQCRECGTLSNDETVFCAICGTKFLDNNQDFVGSVTPEQQDILNTNTPSENTSVSPLLKTIGLFLEDEEFDRADAYCERVLDRDQTNAEAYFYKLLVEFGCSSVGRLKESAANISSSKNYAKVLRFGSEHQRKLLQSIDEEIQRILQVEAETSKEIIADNKPNEDLVENEEYYIDLYCPFCRAELSYTNWQIAEGTLICPECDMKFAFNEGIRR